MAARGVDHDRFGEAVADADHRDAAQALDRQIAAVEVAIDEAVNKRDVASGSTWRSGRDEPSRGR